MMKMSRTPTHRKQTRRRRRRSPSNCPSLQDRRRSSRDSGAKRPKQRLTIQNN